VNGISFTLYLFMNEDTELFETHWVCRHQNINLLPIPCKPLLYCAVGPFFGRAGEGSVNLLYKNHETSKTWISWLWNLYGRLQSC